jgi:hypothetical protein
LKVGSVVMEARNASLLGCECAGTLADYDQPSPMACESDPVFAEKMQMGGNE